MQIPPSPAPLRVKGVGDPTDHFHSLGFSMSASEVCVLRRRPFRFAPALVPVDGFDAKHLGKFEAYVAAKASLIDHVAFVPMDK